MWVSRFSFLAWFCLVSCCVQEGALHFSLNEVNSTWALKRICKHSSLILWKTAACRELLEINLLLIHPSLFHTCIPPLPTHPLPSLSYIAPPFLTPPLLKCQLPAETERAPAQRVCSQCGLKILEGPAQRGEGSQASAPARTTAARNPEVSGRSVCACLLEFVCVCDETSGRSPGRVRVRHIQSTFLRFDGCKHRCESTLLA